MFRHGLLVLICLTLGACQSYRDFYAKTTIEGQMRKHGAQVVKIGDHTRIILPTDNMFLHNSHVIKPDSAEFLQNFAAYLRKFEDLPIIITGHTDNVGSMAFNRKLSRKRAQSLAAFFWASGVKGTKLITEGMGEEAPIATNRTTKGSAMNRRIEIYVPPLG